MKITFCLPQPSKSPVGGYKIVYEYANRLTARGHSVTIVHDSATFSEKYIGFLGRNFFTNAFKTVMLRIFRNKIKWFELSENVRVINSVRGINENTVPDGDIVIATAIETVEPVNNLSLQKGNKVCFVQDIENWNFDDEYVNYTYSLPFKYIAISDWIKDRISQFSELEVAVIYNGLDFSKLYVTNDIAKRNLFSVSMLYHIMPHKGSKYGIEALMMLKKDLPELRASMFGTPDRPSELPEWVEYTKCATAEQLLEIYNNSAIFLCPTIDEGFGLTGAESMACGCVLVSTDYRGVQAYAVNGRNSVLCERENAVSLYNAMKDIMNDNEKRIYLAQNAVKDIKMLDWNSSVAKFEQILKEL